MILLIILLLFGSCYAGEDVVDGHLYYNTEILEVNGIDQPNTAPSNSARIYFDTTDKKLKASEDGNSYVDLIGAGSGDITDVWSCTSGNCNALTAAAGDTLNAGSADSTIACKVATDCSAETTEGECCWDSDNDKYYIGDGSSVVEIGAGGATAYDDIGDPDANSTIAFAGYTNTWTSTLDTGTMFKIDNTDADLAGDTILAALEFTDDGDANGIFLRATDNNGDTQFEIGANGDTTIGDGSSGSIDLGTNTIDDTLAGNLQKGVINLDVTSAQVSGGFIGLNDSTQGAQIDGSIHALLFDDTTDEDATWKFRMPYDYDNGLTAKIQYSMASATSGTVEFEIFVMAVSDGDSQDLDTGSFDTVNVGSATVPGTAGYIDEISITLSNDDSVAAGDWVVIDLSTDADDATNDTATGDREVRNFQLEYNRK